MFDLKVAVGVALQMQVEGGGDGVIFFASFTFSDVVDWFGFEFSLQLTNINIIAAMLSMCFIFVVVYQNLDKRYSKQLFKGLVLKIMFSSPIKNLADAMVSGLMVPSPRI